MKEVNRGKARFVDYRKRSSMEEKVQIHFCFDVGCHWLSVMFTTIRGASSRPSPYDRLVTKSKNKFSGTIIHSIRKEKQNKNFFHRLLFSKKISVGRTDGRTRAGYVYLLMKTKNEGGE